MSIWGKNQKAIFFVSGRVMLTDDASIENAGAYGLVYSPPGGSQTIYAFPDLVRVLETEGFEQGALDMLRGLVEDIGVDPHARILENATDRPMGTLLEHLQRGGIMLDMGEESGSEGAVMVASTQARKEPWQMLRREWAIARDNARGNIDELKRLSINYGDRERSILREANEKGETLSRDQLDELLFTIAGAPSHLDVVELALSVGYPVPQEVLEEYADQPEIAPHLDRMLGSEGVEEPTLKESVSTPPPVIHQAEIEGGRMEGPANGSTEVAEQETSQTKVPATQPQDREQAKAALASIRNDIPHINAYANDLKRNYHPKENRPFTQASERTHYVGVLDDALAKLKEDLKMAHAQNLVSPMLWNQAHDAIAAGDETLVYLKSISSQTAPELGEPANELQAGSECEFMTLY